MSMNIRELYLLKTLIRECVLHEDSSNSSWLDDLVAQEREKKNPSSPRGDSAFDKGYGLLKDAKLARVGGDESKATRLFKQSIANFKQAREEYRRVSNLEKVKQMGELIVTATKYLINQK